MRHKVTVRSMASEIKYLHVIGYEYTEFSDWSFDTVRLDAVTAPIWKKIFGSRQYLVGYKTAEIEF